MHQSVHQSRFAEIDQYTPKTSEVLNIIKNTHANIENVVRMSYEQIDNGKKQDRVKQLQDQMRAQNEKLLNDLSRKYQLETCDPLPPISSASEYYTEEGEFMDSQLSGNYLQESEFKSPGTNVKLNHSVARRYMEDPGTPDSSDLSQSLTVAASEMDDTSLSSSQF